ncbi:MAG: CoA transferase [Acidimicrobiia bacterium]
MPWSPEGDGALRGLRVVDLGQYVAGPLAALLLAEQGADVIHLDPPGGPRWDTPANAYLLSRRRRIELDLSSTAGRDAARRLVASADVVVEGFRPGVADRLGVGPDESRASNPRLVYCSLPGFGATDERAGVPGWEGVVMAAAGGYSASLPLELMPGDSSNAPVAFTALPLASVFAGLQAALGIVAALVARDRDGTGQWIEVPLFDALAEAIGVRAVSQERNGPSMLLDFGQGFYRGADGGHVNAIMVQHRHLAWLAATFGDPDDPDFDFARLRDDSAAGAALRARLVAELARRPAAEWEHRGQQAGVPIARLRTTREWLDEPAARAGGSVAEIVAPDGTQTRGPGPAVVDHGRATAPLPAVARPSGADTAAVLAALGEVPDPVPAPAPGTGGAASTAPPLAGTRVLDMSRVVAGPTVGRLLGQLGAEVMVADADPSARRVAVPEPIFHDSLNRAKRSAVVDLRGASGRDLFADLVRSADVVVQNTTMSAGARLGADPDAVRALDPTTVVLYLNTYGRSGPWADHRGYAEIANTVTGVAERSAPAQIDSGSSPFIDRPRWPFTDYAAGVIGAFGAVVGLLRRSRDGAGPLVETSLVRAAMVEQCTMAVDLPGVVGHEPRGEDAVGWDDAQRTHLTADGAIFVGIGPAQRGAVLERFGIDDLAELGPVLAGTASAEAVAELRAAGAGAHRLCDLAELVGPDGAFAARGLRCEDTSPETGRIVTLGPAVRLARTPARPGPLPGPFGAATAEAVRARRVIGWPCGPSGPGAGG